MFLLCFTKILDQAFYMTHTFDSEISLHYWLLWPTVRRRLSSMKNPLTPRNVGHARHAHRKGRAHPERRRRHARPANERHYLGLRPARPLGLRLTTNLLRLTTNLHAIIHHARNFKELYKNFDFLFSFWLGELKIHTALIKDCMLYSDT